MNYEILDEHGIVLKTIVADEAFVIAHFPGQYRPSPNQDQRASVPDHVSRRQGRQALLLAGKLAAVQPAIDAIADTVQRGLAQIEWDDSQDFERQRPLVIAIGTAIGLTSADLDALFIQAAAL